MEALSDVMNRAAKMIYDDANRDHAFEAYEQMYHNGWTLPPEVRNVPWVKRVISSDPHDAVATGVRVLSTLPITPRYQPLAPGSLNQAKADDIERTLMWQLRSTNRRRSKTVEADMAKSAILYDSIAAQVIDLERAVKTKDDIHADAKREKAALRYSRFVVQTYRPRDVHAIYSGIMPEAVCLVQLKHAAEVLADWGDMARQHPALVDMAGKPMEDWVTYVDYTDYGTRAVWVVPGIVNTVERIIEDQSMVILHDDYKLPFLNWIALMGGSTLEVLSEHKYQPLLYAVYTSGAWDIQNIVRTLGISEAIAQTGSPRLKEEGPNPKTAKVDYMSPERIAKVPAGNTLNAIEPHVLDAALANIDAIMAAQIDKSTLSRVLQGGDLPSGIAFATLNLATQNAVGVLKPYKDLAEKGLAEVLTLMLLWTEFTKQPLYAYSEKKETRGKQMVVLPEDIDPSAVYIEVEMHPDAPTDRQQRVNTAAIAVDRLFLPIEQALEEIGVADPTTAMRKRRKEILIENHLNLLMQEQASRMQMRLQLEMQQAQMAMQAQMQQQMAMQEQAAMEEQQMQMAAMQPTPQQGFDVRPGPRGTPRGQGVNPAMGGQPPASFNPEATREFTGGEDMLGNEVLL